GTSDTVDFTIAKASSTVTVSCPTGVYFTGAALTLCTAEVTGVGGLKKPVTDLVYSANTAVGTANVVATYAGDANHNGSTGTGSFAILAWRLGGFYQPVDMGGVVNTVKAGSTVPLKFEIFSGSTELTSTSAVQGFTVNSVTCATGAVAD